MARTNPATGTKHAADRRAKSAAYGDGVLHPASSGSVVVVGAGMVAHRFVESLTSRDADGRWSVTVLGDEARGPYDRVGLTGYFSGKTPDDLALDRAVLDHERVRVETDARVTRIDRENRTVTTAGGSTHSYDRLVLATGSYAARLALDGFDHRGCFVYRTLDDVAGMRDVGREAHGAAGSPPARRGRRRGLLGLEAAGALQAEGVSPFVLQSNERLMSAQLDLGGAKTLQRLIEARGIEVRTQSVTTRVDADRSGAVVGLELRDGTWEPVDIVVFTVGVRPRDELARTAELAVDARGGVVIDAGCDTSDPAILAIGEVASFGGQASASSPPGMRWPRSPRRACSGARPCSTASTPRPS